MRIACRTRTSTSPFSRSSILISRYYTRDVVSRCDELMADKDHVDLFLERFGERLPVMDLVVEGIVDRITGLSKRLHREMDETLEAFGLNSGESKVLGILWRGGEPHRASPGVLARLEDLSTGAMTNRLDRLEEAGFVRRLPDPGDRRAVQVELTEKGKRAWEKAIAAQAKKEALVASA